jgi:hypothetical protein
MRVRRPAAAPHEAAEELQPAGLDPDHVTPFGAADGAVSHIADEVHGVSLGFLVPAKLQQVVVVFRKRLQERGAGATRSAKRRICQPRSREAIHSVRPLIRPILRKAMAVDAAPMAINSSQAQMTAHANNTTTTPR